MSEKDTTEPAPDKPLLSIVFNIILPVVLLQQLSKHLGANGPVIALVVALLFPLVYGLYDYFKNHRKNYISLIGLVNVMVTGGLALLQLTGIWFAIKEAAFPLIIGIAVFISAFTKKPLMKLLACNRKVMDVDLIETALRANHTEEHFEQHLKTSTFFLTLSFLMSSTLNFLLARTVYVSINPHLSAMQRQAILNAQIAKMTWMSFVAIMLPLTVFMMLIMWHLLSGIKKMTGLPVQQFLVQR